MDTTLPVTITAREVGRAYQPGQLKPVRALSFDVTCDMLELADDFNLQLAFDVDLWNLLRTDAEVEIHVGESRVLTGYVGTRRIRDGKSGCTIEVSGRDKGGRLVDDSAPLVTFAGLGIKELAQKIVTPWFSDVVLTNAKNRQLIRGRGKPGAPTAGEPLDRGKYNARTQKVSKLRRKVQPGEERARVLQSFLEAAGMLGWSSADGRTFFVGQPNHEQAPQWRFILPADVARTGEASALEFEFVDTVDERYAMIVACGGSKPSAAGYGSAVTKRRGVAKNNPASTDGSGKDFQRRKTLLIADDELPDAAAAKDRAELEMRIRDARGQAIEILAPGAGQQFGASPQISTFAFDTIAHVEHEPSGIEGDYLVTRCRFRLDKNGGQVTELSMVPRGTELVAR